MRVLIHDYGGYVFTAQLARALALRGHQVLYLYSVTNQLVQRFSPHSELDHLTIVGVSLPGTFLRYKYLQRWKGEHAHGREVARRMLTFRPDVVLSANSPLDTQKLIQSASHEVGAKFIFWMQDAIGLATKIELSSRIPLIGEMIGDHYLRLEKSLVKSSDEVIVIAENLLDYLRQRGIDPARVTVIPNWAPLEDIPVLPKDNRWAQLHDLTNKFVFMYSGVLGLRHDAKLFLELAQNFKQQPEVHIVVVSGGQFADALNMEAQVRELKNLIVLPFQPAAIYPEMLAGADVLMTILRSNASAYSVPSKVYSYMCAARPQLLSIDTGNPVAKLVTQQKIGLVSAPGDVDAWIQNAFGYYQNHNNNYQMGMNARAYADENFKVDHIADEFEEMIQRA